MIEMRSNQFILNSIEFARTERSLDAETGIANKFGELAGGHLKRQAYCRTDFGRHKRTAII